MQMGDIVTVHDYDGRRGKNARERVGEVVVIERKFFVLQFTHYREAFLHQELPGYQGEETAYRPEGLHDGWLMDVLP